MSANTVESEKELADSAVAWLRDRLPSTWEIGSSNRVELTDPTSGRVDLALDIRGPGGTYATVAVEVKQKFGPRDIDRLLGGLSRVLRTLAGNVAIFVVAPWLSSRTQELLRIEGINYLDLTGNAYFRLDNPTLFIQTQGSARDPNPAIRSKARVVGPKAGRLVRFLVDFRPPYGVRELAVASGLTPGYVSRLLDTMDAEALVDRSLRGGVESVDVPRLVTKWSETYDVFRANNAQTFLSPAGPNQALSRLETLGERVAVTGSFAAVRIAPVAAPALLMAYCDNEQELADVLGLIPADQGSNVILLKPYDPVVWQGTAQSEGTTFVAPSQAAVDCLTGNGRMPAEGEALLSWMGENQSYWRQDHLPLGERVPA